MSETLSPLNVIQNEIRDIKEYINTIQEHKDVLERLFVYKTALNKPVSPPSEMIESGQACIDEMNDFLENTKERHLLPLYEKYLANADPKEKEEIIANKEQWIEQLYNDLLKKRVEQIQEKPMKVSYLTRMMKDEDYMKSLFEE